MRTRGCVDLSTHCHTGVGSERGARGKGERCQGASSADGLCIARIKYGIHHSAAGGAALGSMISPGAGTAFGGTVGGALGGKLASAAVHRIRHRNDKHAQQVAVLHNREELAHAEDAAAVRHLIRD